jgi:hypothetical protein
MDERRRTPRKYLNYFSRVTEQRTGRMLGYLVDLHTGGALLVGNIPLDTNVEYELRIDLPEGFSTTNEMSIKARAVWVRPDDDPEFYRIGLQLTQISLEDLVTLERLLSSYGA